MNALHPDGDIGPGGRDLLGIDAIRADGELVHIRQAAPTDRRALLALNSHTSAHSLYLRFFSLSRHAADSFVDILVRPRSSDHCTLIALADSRVVGVACYEVLNAESADVGFLVDDDHQHLGIGTLLLEQLAICGRAAGLVEFRADVLASNSGMLEVFREVGLAVQSSLAGGVIRLTCCLELGDIARAAMGNRVDVAAAARRLRHPSATSTRDYPA